MKIIFVIGTRPEAIKLAPLIILAKKEVGLNIKVIVTAQHREMLDQVLDLFDIVPDYDLDIMKDNQSISEVMANVQLRINNILLSELPNMVIIQGDTTTVAATAIACFYNKIPIGHVEAGLRTGDLDNPFPEEFNRVLVSRIATLHFAATDSSKNNLLKEFVREDRIFVTGNTVIDALYSISKRNLPINIKLQSDKRIIILTAHRRENFGRPLENILQAVKELAIQRDDIQIVYPVHPNPNVLFQVKNTLKDIKNILLTEPLDYIEFVSLLKLSSLVLTDSGGIQEEAPALGKPVLVLRRETERPEAVREGVVKLVGSNKELIIHETNRLLDNIEYYKSMSKGVSPYGDGFASSRIIQVIKEHMPKI